MSYSELCVLYIHINSGKCPGGSMSQVVGLPNNSYKPITNTAWIRARLCKLQKECARLAAASDKVYQLLAHGRWFSPGTPASFNTKTGRHDIAEILLKVALNTINQIKPNVCTCIFYHSKERLNSDNSPILTNEQSSLTSNHSTQRRSMKYADRNP